MNTDKKVFNKLFVEDKVELESQKVELGLTQDAQSLLKLLKSFNDAIKSDGDKANALYDKVSVNGQKALMVFKESMKVLEKINQAYENIGMATDTDPNYNALLKEADVTLAYRKKYNF
jgi:hypothetical protein